MSVIVEVPVKRYIKHYLTEHYPSPKNSSVVMLDKMSIIGRHFYRLLDDPCNHRDKEVNLNYFNSIVQIEISEHVLLRRGYYLTRTNTVDFNAVVEQEIKLQANAYIDGIMQANPTWKISMAIDSFLKKVRLDNEILPFDSMKKSYYRYRMAMRHRQHIDNERL